MTRKGEEDSRKGEEDSLAIILEEIRDSYQIQLDVKTGLEDKAKNIIIVSGLMIPILFGINRSLHDMIKISTPWVNYGLIVNFISLLSAIISVTVVGYDVVLGNPKKESIAMMKINAKNKLLDYFIEEYRKAINTNSKKNRHKSIMVVISQLSLVFSTLIFSYLLISNLLRI